MAAHNKMSRRDFLRSTAATAALAALAPGLFISGRARGNSSSTPNILLIMTDEHNAGVLGAAGNAIAQTPNLDALAQHGVIFDNCYCNSPLCVPSRLSLTAGKYPSRVGAWGNQSWLPSADYPSLPRILNAAGYESFLCGKMHYDYTRRYGFTEIGGNLNTSVKYGRERRRLPDELEPQPGISDRLTDIGIGQTSIHVHDQLVAAGAVEFLNQRQAADGPFFLALGFVAPHFPLKVPEGYWTPYIGQVPLPVIPEGHVASQSLNYQHLRIAFNVEDVPDEVVRDVRELYYAHTQWADGQIGQVLDALAASELADNTIVIYTTDHGENMGEHGLWWKSTMYEHAARVPLIINWPARWAGNQRRAGVCSLLDLNRTIAELGGADVPGDWNGDSMLGWLDDPNAPWKDFAVSEYYGHNIASGSAMVRSGNYKYVCHARADDEHPAERELYDLQADPGEFTNLAALPEHQNRIRAMHDALVDEIGKDVNENELRFRADCYDFYPGRELW